MVETLTMYPAPKVNDGTNKGEWTPDKLLKRGEYDLVNISLIGFDPNTGWTYDRCQDAWDAALARAQKEEAEVRWWQLRRRWKLRLVSVALYQRRGLP